MYYRRGEEVIDESAYLAGDPEGTPIVVLPTSKILPARWSGVGVVDLHALSARARYNINFITDPQTLAENVDVFDMDTT